MTTAKTLPVPGNVALADPIVRGQRRRHWPEKLRGPIKVHGGKSYLCRRILARAPAAYDLLVDPFGGGGSVTLNAPRGVAGHYNDADWRKATVFACIKDPATYPLLADRLAQFTYDDATFRAARARDVARTAAPGDAGLVDATADVIVRSRMSRGGMGEHLAWSDRQRGGRPGDENAWATFLGLLPDLHDRLRAVTVTCGDGIALIAGLRRAAPGLRPFVYVDPPYMRNTRVARAAYGAFEMTDGDHRRLLDACTSLSPDVAVAISGYRNELYDETLAGWHRTDIDMPNHAGQGASKQRRTECLWTNYP